MSNSSSPTTRFWFVSIGVCILFLVFIIASESDMIQQFSKLIIWVFFTGCVLGASTVLFQFFTYRLEFPQNELALRNAIRLRKLVVWPMIVSLLFTNGHYDTVVIGGLCGIFVTISMGFSFLERLLNRELLDSELL